MRAQLVPIEGGAPIDIVKDLVVVGRLEECDLRLEHKSVSKLHCVIVKTDGLLLLRDLGSTNGTRVNGTRVRRACLLPNDQVSIAHYKFRVYLGPDVLPASHAYERTQHLDSQEVADLLRKSHAQQPDDADDSAELPQGQLLQQNQLPDVYPEDATGAV